MGLFNVCVMSIPCARTRARSCNAGFQVKDRAMLFWRSASPGPRPARDAPDRGLIARDGANPESRAQGSANNHSSNFGGRTRKSRCRSAWFRAMRLDDPCGGDHNAVSQSLELGNGTNPGQRPRFGSSSPPSKLLVVHRKVLAVARFPKTSLVIDRIAQIRCSDQNACRKDNPMPVSNASNSDRKNVES